MQIMDAKYYTLMMIISNQDILNKNVHKQWRQNLSRRSGKFSMIMTLLQSHLQHISIITMSVLKF